MARTQRGPGSKPKPKTSYMIKAGNEYIRVRPSKRIVKPPKGNGPR